MEVNDDEETDMEISEQDNFSGPSTSGTQSINSSANSSLQSDKSSSKLYPVFTRPTEAVPRKNKPELPYVSVQKIKTKKGSTVDDCKKTADDIIKEYTKLNSKKSLYDLVYAVENPCANVQEVLLYRQYRKPKPDSFLLAFGCKEVQGGPSNCIAFIILSNSMYALTKAQGYMALRKHLDYDFPQNIATKILEEKGANAHKIRHLLGNNILSEEILKEPVHLNRLEYGNYCIEFTASLKTGCEVFRYESMKGITNLNVTVGSGVVNFDKKFLILDAYKLVTFLEKTFNDTRPISTSSVFSQQLSMVDVSCYETLQNSLKADICKAIFESSIQDSLSNITICHFHAKDYTRSRNIRLRYNKKVIGKLNYNSTLRDVIPKIYESRLGKPWPLEEIQKALMKYNIQFKTPNGDCQYPFFSFLEGEYFFNKKLYWRMGKKWYFMNDDYIKRVQTDFQNLLREHLLPTDSDFQLPPWTTDTKRESDYNNSFKNQTNFYVGDQLCFFNLELFDIMRIEDIFPNKTTVLYHVKKDFAQKTRDACSQICNSAQILNGLKGSHDNQSEESRKLDEIAGKLKLSEKKLKSYLGLTEERNVIYILGLVSNANLSQSSQQTLNLSQNPGIKERVGSRSLHREKELELQTDKTKLRERLESNEDQRKDIQKCMFNNFDSNNLNQLIDNLVQYLELDGFLKPPKVGNSTFETTTKLIFSNDKDFQYSFEFGNVKEREKAQKSLANLLAPYRTLFPSIIAKMDIIRARHFLIRTLMLEKGQFKICEIPTS